jgi:hypothetical protein
MGCGTSKLKGDSFDGVDASAYPPVPRDKAEEPKPFTYSIGEASHSEGVQSSPAPRQSSENEKGASSNATSRPTLGAPSDSTSMSRKEALRNSSSKLSTLRQQWKGRRGVPEPRDPVTGRGLHTGLTPEELKKLVESTRAAGSTGFATGGFGAGNLDGNYIVNEHAREGTVRPEELEALKNWQNQSQESRRQ